METSDFSDIRTFSLKSEIGISELINGQEFELDKDTDLKYNEEEENNFNFKGEELLKNLNLECAIPTEEENVEEGDIQTPFESLINNMEPIFEDQVYKKLTNPGSGETPAEKSIIMLHYNAYLEFSDEPFDSSRLRNIPTRFMLGTGSVIRGLEKAAETMKKGERAQFLIRPDYAYGRRGIPPRIPENATILFDVELLNFVDCANAVEYEELSVQEKKEVSFSNVLKVAQTEHYFANEFFSKIQYKKAVAKYKKAAVMLENVTLKNQAEEDECHKCLLKLYNNISLCFLKLSEIKLALVYGRKAVNIDGNNTKALFRYGQALMHDGQYRQARNYLMKAKKKEPFNGKIIEELYVLDNKEMTYHTYEKKMYQKMFNSNSDAKEQVTSADQYPASEEFRKSIEAFLREKMKDKDVQEIPFSSGLSNSELACIKCTAKTLGLSFIEEDIAGFKQVKVIK